MSFLIYSNSLPSSHLDAMKKIIKTRFIRLPRSKALYNSISSHPDIRICKIDTDTFILDPTLSLKLIETLKKYNKKLIFSKNIPFGEYPQTSILNVCRIDNKIFYNRSFTDSSIVDFSKRNNLKLIHVNQGYARCSIVPVSNNAIITSDRGISSNAKKHGIDTLLISSKQIVLPGQKHGFIGGASGILSDGTTLFLGDIRLHPDFKKIDGFFNKHKQSYLYLPKLELFDAGTIITG